MLTIKASAKPSPIHGIGLFADEDIPKGSVTWKYDPRFDISFDPKEVEKMTETEKAFIQHYAYLSKKSDMYILPGDDSRFTNHSNEFNIEVVDDDREFQGRACKDIKSGEELTVDYHSFDSHDESSNDKYLSRPLL